MAQPTQQHLPDQDPAEQYPPVRKTVTVQASPEECFRTFTQRPLDWWPPHHVLVRQPREAIVFQPHVGGRYYERAVDGTEADWGTILAWNPPHGLRMTWRINGQWQPIDDEDRASEIEVTFRRIDDHTTEVTLTHLNLHRHGPDAARIHQALQGPSPGETLERFEKAV